jgi:hypothetical protein
MVLGAGPASATPFNKPVEDASPTCGSLNSAKAAATTLDFSTVSQRPFDPSLFKAEGVVLTEGNFVGFSLSFSDTTKSGGLAQCSNDNGAAVITCAPRAITQPCGPGPDLRGRPACSARGLVR